MTEYMFERASGTLNKTNVKNIITQAGVNTGLPDYDPSKYTYTEKTTKEVWAKGTGVMATAPLEHAARQLGISNVTVTISSSDTLEDRTYQRVNVGSQMSTIGNLLGASHYGVKIKMSQETVDALSTGGYFLYGFKSIQANAGGGRPLVWFRSVDFGLETDVSWEIEYQAYTSRSHIIPGGQIKGLSPYDIALGQRLEVESPQGTGNVVDGSAGTISIENLTDSQVTCGISEVVNGTAQPLCAFPLYGNGMDVMVPIQKVMLTFATKEVNTGTVVEKAYSQSILIDLTAKTERTVTFDINKGWAWGGFNWAQAIRPSTDIVPLLIETSL